MAMNDKNQIEKLQYHVNRVAAKISPFSSGKINMGISRVKIYFPYKSID